MAIRLMLIMALLAPAAVRAAGKVDEAEQLVAKMEYKKALKVVGRILSSPKSEPEDLAAAFRLQGMCMIGMGKNKKAIESFRKLLAIQPTYRLPKETSPSAKAPFFKALSMKGQKPIALSHKAPEKAPKRLGGFKLFVKVESNPFKMIRAVRLRYKNEKSVKWRKAKTKLKRPGRVACKLPKKLRAKEIQYYFEAINKKGGVLGRAGSADEPFKLGGKAEAPVVAAVTPEPAKPAVPDKPEEAEPPKETPKETPKEVDPVTDFESTEEEKPVASEETAAKKVVESTEAAPPEAEPERDNGAWYTTWWFWTAVGVVAAGAVTGVVIAATAGGDSGTPSAYEVIMDW
jgi:hypothetical protein